MVEEEEEAGFEEGVNEEVLAEFCCFCCGLLDGMGGTVVEVEGICWRLGGIFLGRRWVRCGCAGGLWEAGRGKGRMAVKG